MLLHVVVIFLLFAIPYSHGQCENSKFNVNQQSNTSSCMVWGGYSVKTFDDHSFNVKSTCAFTLTEFAYGTSQFKVNVRKSARPCTSTDCVTLTDILYRNEIYRLGFDGQQKPVLGTSSRNYPMPYDLPGISFYKRGERVFVDFTDIGCSIAWDLKNNVQVTIENSRGYSVKGLCGNNDGCSVNDQTNTNLEDFLRSWQIDGTCSDIQTKSPCGILSYPVGEIACGVLKQEQKFAEANKVVNPEPYIQACIWNYCACSTSDGMVCLCESIDAYVKASINAGVPRISWREKDLCAKNCSGDLHFQPCAPKGGVRTCGDSGPSPIEEKCEEGCYCLPNNFLFNGKCYLKKNCPCSFRGKIVQPGETVPNDCNTCTCTNGKLECTDDACSSGSCQGDPHCTTFDGKKFDFMGKCKYYLVKGPDFTVEADMFGLSKGQFLKNYTKGPSYIREVTVKMSGQVVVLKPQFVTEVNGIVVKRYPYPAGDLLVTKPSDLYVVVYLPNNVQVVWNGVWTVTVKVPHSLEGKLMGLLGTYTDDASDDFMTPDGEIVTSPIVFGNSWKMDGTCQDEPLTPIEHPCIANPTAKARAEKACSIIKSPEFRKCMKTDPDVDYENCVYDACYYEEDIAKSYCDSISVSAEECGSKGITLNWRDRVPECKVQCPPDLIYRSCSNACTRTCEDIARRPRCANTCVEGCNCPEGKTLNEENVCVPVSQCKCTLNCALYPPGFQYLKDGEEIARCEAGKWIIIVPDEIPKIPDLNELNKKCESINNSIYTPCRFPEPETCQNMANYPTTSINICLPGCQCKDGYVWDAARNQCMLKEQCPCFNNGISYPDGAISPIGSCPSCTCRGEKWNCSQCCSQENAVKQDGCKVCVCLRGIWQCSESNCVGPPKCQFEDEIRIMENGKCICKKGEWKCVKAQCDIWGDSHIKTFDEMFYDFQGECSYTLVQGELNEYFFNVIVTNERCSHAGDTCLRSVTIKVYVKGVPEIIILTKNQNLPDTNDKKWLLLVDYSSFVTVDIGAGVQIFWDKKTWLNVKVENQWRDKVAGLCGNFNGTKDDDLMVNGEIITREDAHIFVSIWKVECTTGPKQKYCSPERIKWAQGRCNILLSSLFSQCHGRVPVHSYYDACVLDTCKCEYSGDCQSLCTAVSAYVQQCNNFGISVNWRTQQFCPLQCNGNTYYKTCMFLCPPKTCDLVQRNIGLNCDSIACVEGCAPKNLPDGFVWSVPTFDVSIPESSCSAPKCNVNGINFYDQEVISKTNCKLRYCSAGREICVKLPTCPKDGSSSETMQDCSCSCPLCS